MARNPTNEPKQDLTKTETFEEPKSVDLVEKIRLRAYEIYLGQGSEHGNNLEHWLQAERELDNEN